MNHKVKLFDADANYVTTVMVPGVEHLYDVLIWGDRVFSFNPHYHEYHESSAINVFTQAELDEARASGIFT